MGRRSPAGGSPSRDQVARWGDEYHGGHPLIDALACADQFPEGDRLSPLRWTKRGSYERQGLLMGVRLPLFVRHAQGQERPPLAGFPGDGAA